MEINYNDLDYSVGIIQFNLVQMIVVRMCTDTHQHLGGGEGC